jgi:hypothetical protein
MSLIIAAALSHVRDRIPTADVSVVGATLYVKGDFDSDDIEAVAGDEVSGRVIELVDYWSDERKAVLKLKRPATERRQKIEANY